MELNLGDFSVLRRWAAATNAGMLLKTELERGLNIISFASSESPSAGLRPELVLGYEPLVTNTDLWDVSRGTVITASSGVGAGALENMFGAQAFSAEPRNAFFADGRPGGSTHFVEWRTLRPIRLRAFHLQGLDDGIATGGLRGFNQFTLFARSLINDQWIPVHRSATPSPYPPDPVTGSAQFDLTADVSPVVAREFRAEFVQAPNSALSPRIVELDGFGEVIETQTLAVTDRSTWRVKAPFGNLEGTPLKSVGLTFDTTDEGWNSDLTFDDSNTAGWHEPVFRSPREALIWADDPAPFGSSPAFFRKKFLAPPDLRLALLSYFADDDAVIWINGRTVVEDINGSASGRGSIDVTPFLVPGLNLIAVKAHDSFSLAPLGQNGESFGMQIDGELGGSGCVPAPSGLLSFWRGEKEAFDAVSSGSGSLQGGIGFAAGVAGSAFVFDGVDDIISLGTSSSMRRSSAVTYAFWAKLPPGGGGEAMGVGAEGGQGFGGVLMRSNLLSFRWTPSSPAGDAQLSATSVSIPSDQWVHVAVAIDFVAQQGRLYLNGKEATSEVRNLSNQPIVNWVPDGFFNFGLEDSIGGRVVDTASFFQGALDEVGIFDRALSQAEVTALASSGKAGLCLDCREAAPGLIALWDFDELAPASVVGRPEGHDLSGGGLSVDGKSGPARRILPGTALSTYGSGALNLGHNELTLESWLRLEPNPDGAQRFSAVIGKNGAPHRQPFLLLFESGAHVGLPQDQWLMGFALTGRDGAQVENQRTGVRVPADGNFHHVALTYNGADVILYVDGLARGTFPFSGLLLQTPKLPFSLSTGQVPFSIDALAVHSRALSSGEVLASASRSGLSPCLECADAPSGLLGFWRAEFQEGGIVTDAAFTQSGELMNGARGGPGMRGGGFFFDGVDDRVRIPFVPSFRPSRYTLALWVQPLAPIDEENLQELLLGQGVGAPQLTVRPGLDGLKVVSGFRNGREIGGDTFHELVTDASIPFNRYTHVATTWDGTRLKIYLNGDLAQESQPGTPPIFSSHPLFLGGFGGEDAVADAGGYGDQQHFHGLIDEAMLWGRALDAAEILRVVRSQAAGVCRPVAPTLSSPVLAGAEIPIAHADLRVAVRVFASEGGSGPDRIRLSWTGTSISGDQVQCGSSSLDAD